MMASFSRRPSRLWTIDVCALFAARKEFELLKLLSTDKKAMAAARRLGLHAVLPQPLPAKAGSVGTERFLPKQYSSTSVILNFQQRDFNSVDLTASQASGDGR